jgi:3-deoxy-D-manno-octulosonate 8-phosphate phosphatase (KDO 8-P phosphatase)
MPSVVDPALARRIKLVGLDVDGVLTDGGIYLGDVAGARMEFKRYSVQDGLGIELMRHVGLKVVIVTGRVSESVRLRGQELHLDDVAQDALARKLPALRSVLDRHGVTADETAFVGDDIPDLPLRRDAALPVAVGNAVAEVREVCSLQLEQHGGRGAVREFAELLLRARGEWQRALDIYLAARASVTLEAMR